MLLEKDTVSNTKICIGDMFEVVKVNLFSKSLTDAIIRDGGTRERRDVSLSDCY